MCIDAANAIDQKEIQAVFNHFAGYFTLEQVKDTMMANKGDKPKTI